MITRDQFEAHVRAEAERLFDTSSEYIDWHQKQRCERIYIAARMEHEWPLVEALDEARYLMPVNNPSQQLFIKNATAALYPYTTKPIEP